MKTFIVLFTCGILMPLISRSQDFEYSFRENYEVSVPAQLAISSSDGNVDIISSDENKIQVFYIVKKANKLLQIDRRELEKEVEIDVVKTNNSLNIAVRVRKDHHVINARFPINIHFKVYVPKETSCNLHTSDGNISLQGLKSDQSCRTSDGNLVITDITGAVKGKTSDGNITVKRIIGYIEMGTSDGDIQLENIGGDIEASTSDGNIRLVKVKGDVSVKTSDGDISFNEISGSFRANTSDGNIKGNMVELRKELVLKTSGGNIDVEIADQSGLDLDIKGESINVPFKNFDGEFDETFVRGKANGGGIPVTLSASDGHVRLNY